MRWRNRWVKTGAFELPELPRVRFRLVERLPLLYFTYTACLAWIRGIDGDQRDLLVIFALAVGLITWLLALGELRWHARFFNLARDWWPLVLLPVAYWQMSLFQSPQPASSYEYSWVAWDRVVLHELGVKAAIESLGPLLPGFLELSYTAMYALPVLAVAVIYTLRRRERLDQMLFTLLFGSLLAYALFPYFPSQPPRFVFPGEDLPSVVTRFRQFNLWLLDRFDIWTSVFPSGHVTVAFSLALAMRRALPERPRIGKAFLVMAFSIWVATFYGRYHYCVDGLAGMTISLIAVQVTDWLARRGLFATQPVPVEARALAASEPSSIS